jgi:hypothetical protein
VSVQGTLAGAVRPIIRHIIVMMFAVVVMVVTARAMVVVIGAIVHMVMIAIGVGVHHEVREDADWTAVGYAGQRSKHEHQHHRPDQGNAASARSLHSRQHAVR